MRNSRPFLLVVSACLVTFLLGGGILVKVGAAENSYRQAVLFAEVLSLVMENYVDPVDADHLLHGAYEGMLGGLDPNGAYLTPEEVRDWKSGTNGPELVDPGISVLKAGRSIHVVAVAPSSPAAQAGLEVGDQIRDVAGKPTRDLSLEQVRRMLRGEPGTKVLLDYLRPGEGFRPEQVEVARAARRDPPYELNVERGVAVLRIRNLARLQAEPMLAEIDDVRSRGVEYLLLDLRNLTEGGPRDATHVAALFASAATLKLRDRSGRLLESVDSEPHPAWAGKLGLLINSATAGGAEALALLVKERGDVSVFGEPTYGLGAEAKLYALENGSGLLVSAALWETGAGEKWNGGGVQPDQTVEAEGDTVAEAEQKRLERVLDLIDEQQTKAQEVPKAA